MLPACRGKITLLVLVLLPLFLVPARRVGAQGRRAPA